jgi:hypothetical protein
MPHAETQGISSSGLVKSPGSSTSAYSKPGLLTPDTLGHKMKVEVPVAIGRNE